MKPSNVLILPGWQNSGPQHWQSLWEKRHGYERVEQHDWMQPLRGDWMARLEEVVLARDEPAVLVAHSLGCILAAAWAAHSRTRTGSRPRCWWRRATSSAPKCASSFPAGRRSTCSALPFPSVLLASRNDPYCEFERARLFAHAWGAQFMDYGDCGHINADSGPGRAGPKATCCCKT